jgi:hypothetical protein
MVPVTFGESKSRVGRRHANNPWSNVGISVKGSSLNLSRNTGRDTAVSGFLSVAEREQIHINDAFTEVKRKGTPRVLKDGSIFWTVPKRTLNRKVDECDMWRPTKIKKVLKMNSKRVGSAARGQSDTQGASLQKQDRG